MRHLRDNAEKYGTARQVIDGNIVQCMCFAWQIIKATYTYSEYVNTYCFSTPTMVTQRHLNATLYAHSLCCFDICPFFFSETWYGHKTWAGHINL
jgi:hypothetical protein